MRVLYAGSFDPFHEGHLCVVERAAMMFDEVVVAAVANPGKPRRTPLDQRADNIRTHVGHLPNVTVVWHEGLTTQLAAAIGAGALIRGAARGHREELEMARANEAAAGIPTLFVPADASSRLVSSTGLRAESAP